jgi:hypothetical protein
MRGGLGQTRHVYSAFTSTRFAERHSLPYSCGIVCLTPLRPRPLFDEARHQVGKLQEIGHPEQRATLADDDLWIGCDDVGPLPRHRANLILVNAQQQPRAVPVVALTNADELPSRERVERVRHAHKARARVRRACSSC